MPTKKKSSTKKIVKKNPDYSKIVWQTFMPKWHPNENYKISYASKKNLGGGVVLTCSHEIDLATYLFGNVKKVNAFKIKNRMKMNVEDCYLIFKRDMIHMLDGYKVGQIQENEKKYAADG